MDTSKKQLMTNIHTTTVVVVRRRPIRSPIDFEIFTSTAISLIAFAVMAVS